MSLVLCYKFEDGCQVLYRPMNGLVLALR